MTQGEPGAIHEGEYFHLPEAVATRPRRRWGFFDEPRDAALLAGIMLLGIALRVAATIPFSMHHPDEIIQYLEQAHRLVFGYGVVPWEYRYGMRQWLLPLLLSAPMKLGAIVAPQGDLYLYLPRMCVAMASATIIAAALRLGNGISRVHGLVAMFVAATWFELVYFAAHTLTEPLATAAFLCAACLLLRPFAAGSRALFWGGVLLGLAAILRFHYLPAIGTLAILVCGRDVRGRWLPVAAGGLAALAGAGVIDLAMGQVPFSWIVENVRLNIVADRSAEFGVSGPLAYFGQMKLQWQLAAIPLLFLARSVKQYQPLFWAAVANLAVHMLIGHKEYRFIFLSISVFVIFAAIGSVDLVQRMRRWFPAWRDSRLLTPMALMIAWAALSASLAAARPMEERWTGYEGPLTAMKTAGQTKGLCGIALNRGIDWVAGYTYLHRAVPIYLPGVDVEDTTPATQLAEGAPAYNIILASPRSAPYIPRGYRLRGCHGKMVKDPLEGAVCLFERAGGCDPRAAQDLLIQRVLLRRDR